MTSLTSSSSIQQLTTGLTIANSRSTWHLALKLMSILLLVSVATCATTPTSISKWSMLDIQTIRQPQNLAWYRAIIISIVALVLVIIILAEKGGRIYTDDVVFMAIVTIYCYYWWSQWLAIRETFISSDSGTGGGDGATILATGLSNEEWSRMAVGRTWARDLTVPDKSKLIAGINRPEHYDFAPDDMHLYKLEPDLVDSPATVGVLSEMAESDLLPATVTGAGHGVSRQYQELDGPLPDGRTQWHTDYVQRQIDKTLAVEHRGHGPANGLPSMFNLENFRNDASYDNNARNDSIKKKVAVNICEIGTRGLTNKMHSDWLSNYGYTYMGSGGDEICGELRPGCKNTNRSDCSILEHCSNWPPLMDNQLRKMSRGGDEML